MMREPVDQWDFVIAAYVVSALALGAAILWAWLAMRRAEARRERTGRGQGDRP